MIDPAVGGALSILKSAVKNGLALCPLSIQSNQVTHRNCSSSVRRIVITSSCAAVAQQRSLPAIFSESDWNDEAAENVQRLERDASQLDKYCASKVLSERGLRSPLFDA